MNTCLSNELLFGRGKGTFETTDGHSSLGYLPTQGGQLIIDVFSMDNAIK